MQTPPTAEQIRRITLDLPEPIIRALDVEAAKQGRGASRASVISALVNANLEPVEIKVA